MRDDTTKVRHADGTQDKRYTVAREFTGGGRRDVVARFCGDWIGAEITYALAWSLARAHAVGRGIALYHEDVS